MTATFDLLMSRHSGNPPSRDYTLEDTRIRDAILERISDRPKVTKKGLAESIGKTATWTHTQLLKSPRSTLRYLIAMEPDQAERLAHELGWFSSTHMARDLSLYPELLPEQTGNFLLFLPAHTSLTEYARGKEPDTRESWDSSALAKLSSPNSTAIARVDQDVYLETGQEWLYGARLLLSREPPAKAQLDLAVYYLEEKNAAAIIGVRADQRGVILKSRGRSKLIELAEAEAGAPVAFFMGMVK
jgi:hypothetical protein